MDKNGRLIFLRALSLRSPHVLARLVADVWPLYSPHWAPCPEPFGHCRHDQSRPMYRCHVTQTCFSGRWDLLTAARLFRSADPAIEPFRHAFRESTSALGIVDEWFLDAALATLQRLLPDPARKSREWRRAISTPFGLRFSPRFDDAHWEPNGPIPWTQTSKLRVSLSASMDDVESSFGSEAEFRNRMCQQFESQLDAYISGQKQRRGLKRQNVAQYAERTARRFGGESLLAISHDLPACYVDAYDAVRKGIHRFAADIGLTLPTLGDSLGTKEEKTGKTRKKPETRKAS